MKKSYFLTVKQKYLAEKKRLNKIKPGDLVWEEGYGGGMVIDYHTAVVKKVNIDNSYLEVIDVSISPNREKKLENFLTESELIKDGFTRESIKEEYSRYKEVIDSIK